MTGRVVLISTPFGASNWFWKWWSESIVGTIGISGNSSYQEAQKPMGVSLKPSEAVAGGGGIDDVDVWIKACRFRLWDYNGTIQTPVLGLEVTFADDDGNEASQVYSAGDTKHFVPSEDGSEAVPVGGATNLNDSTNAMAFMVSLVNAGFGEERIADKVSVFEGTKVHVNQVPQPKRKGLTGAKEGSKILLVSKILAFPWDKAAGKAPGIGKGAAPKAAAPKAAAAQAPMQAAAPAGGNGAAAGGNGADASALNGIAMEAMLGIVMGKGGSITKGAIAQEAFKALQAHPQRNALVQLVYSDEFLKQPGAPWTYDGATVSMGG